MRTLPPSAPISPGKGAIPIARDDQSQADPYLRIVAGPEMRSSSELLRVNRRWTGRIHPLVLVGMAAVVIGICLIAGLGPSPGGGMMRVGNMDVSRQEQRMPLRVGIVALTGGVLLMGYGLLNRKA